MANPQPCHSLGWNFTVYRYICEHNACLLGACQKCNHIPQKDVWCITAKELSWSQFFADNKNNDNNNRMMMEWIELRKRIFKPHFKSIKYHLSLLLLLLLFLNLLTFGSTPKSNHDLYFIRRRTRDWKKYDGDLNAAEEGILHSIQIYSFEKKY